MAIKAPPECKCDLATALHYRNIVINYDLALLYGSLALFLAVATRPLRTGRSWFSHTTWVVVCFMDTFTLLTRQVPEDIRKQMAFVGTLMIFATLGCWAFGFISEYAPPVQKPSVVPQEAVDPDDKWKRKL